MTGFRVSTCNCAKLFRFYKSKHIQKMFTYFANKHTSLQKMGTILENNLLQKLVYNMKKCQLVVSIKFVFLSDEVMFRNTLLSTENFQGPSLCEFSKTQKNPFILYFLTIDLF